MQLHVIYYVLCHMHTCSCMPDHCMYQSALYISTCLHTIIGASASNPFSVSELPCGITTGVMGVAIIIITATFITITVTLIRSKRALRVNLDLLKAKTQNEQSAIRDELPLDSEQSSSPTIDTEENIAYVSAFIPNSCTRN